MSPITLPDPADKWIVGMIHLPSLPGAAQGHDRTMDEIIEFACRDARALADGGMDAILLQNAQDHPPRKTVPSATVAAYAVVAAAVRRATDLPLGISVLKSDPAASLAIALAADARFVRLKSYVGAEVGAEGLVEGCAADTVRIRRELGAERQIEIWADAIQPTSKPLGGASVAELASWCVDFGQADRVIVTGGSLEESIQFVAQARSRVGVPVILGGGAEPANARRALEASDGIIVGRFLRGRSLAGPVFDTLVRAVVDAARASPDARAEQTTGAALG
ncbi:MAG TPA: BtpA/SgcQ family protein [Patescibacteria group bacterium]|nr:BtpA/SgcQ family protein [Patescibacteria group bacterium]